MSAALTISIDLELAWGIRHRLSPARMRLVDALDRDIARRLLGLFDRYEVPVTWAFVAALLDAGSAKDMPGSERLWYAPDVIEGITQARTVHDLGSHGGRHIQFDRVSSADAAADLGFARHVHRSAGLAFASFVFPRNGIGQLPLLADAGLRVYRGQDEAWHERLRRHSRLVGRAAHLADKLLRLPPTPVAPRQEGRLVNLPGSMLFLGRNGLRGMVGRRALAEQLNRGLCAAVAQERSFHLWFHPSNFYYRTDEQFAIFENFLRGFTELRDRGRLVARPMAAFA